MMPLLALRLAPYALAGAALIGSHWYAYASGQSDARARAAVLLADSERRHATSLAAATKTVTIEVTKYVDRIQTLPPRTVVRDRLVSRLCDASAEAVRAAADSGLPARGINDAGDRPADSPVEALADDLVTVQVIKARRSALIAIVKDIQRQNDNGPD